MTEERAGRPQDRMYQVLSLRRQRLDFEQQLAQPHNAVERRPDFVQDDRQELRLHPASFRGYNLGCLCPHELSHAAFHLLLHLYALSNVHAYVANANDTRVLPFRGIRKDETRGRCHACMTCLVNGMIGPPLNRIFLDNVLAGQNSLNGPPRRLTPLGEDAAAHDERLSWRQVADELVLSIIVERCARSIDG